MASSFETLVARARQAHLKRSGPSSRWRSRHVLFTLRWQSCPEDPARKTRRATKTKFTCLDCVQNAWAKPDALLISGAYTDEQEQKFILMLASQTNKATLRNTRARRSILNVKTSI